MTCPHCGAAEVYRHGNKIRWLCGTAMIYGKEKSYIEKQSTYCHDRKAAAEIVERENHRNRVSE